MPQNHNDLIGNSTLIHKCAIQRNMNPHEHMRSNGLHLPVILTPEEILTKDNLKFTFPQLPYYLIDTGFHGDLLISEHELFHTHNILLHDNSTNFLKKLYAKISFSNNDKRKDCYYIKRDYTSPTSTIITFNNTHHEFPSYRARVFIPIDNSDFFHFQVIRISVSPKKTKTLIGTGFLAKLNIIMNASYEKMTVQFFVNNPNKA